MSTNQTAKSKLKAEALSAVYQITKQSLEPPSNVTCSCIRATKNQVHPLETKDLSRTHSQTRAYTRALRSAVIHLSLIPTCQTTPPTVSAPPKGDSFPMTDKGSLGDIEDPEQPPASIKCPSNVTFAALRHAHTHT